MNEMQSIEERIHDSEIASKQIQRLEKEQRLCPFDGDRIAVSLSVRGLNTQFVDPLLTRNCL